MAPALQKAGRSYPISTWDEVNLGFKLVYKYNKGKMGTPKDEKTVDINVAEVCEVLRLR